MTGGARTVVVRLAGTAVGKGRPRFVRRGDGSVGAVTPEKTRGYEACVAVAARLAMAGAPPIEGPVAVRIAVRVAVPAGWPASRRAAALAGEVRPTTRPDADNLVKAVLDPLNGIVYRDDAQAVSVSLEKSYAAEAGMEAVVEALPAASAQRVPAHAAPPGRASVSVEEARAPLAVPARAARRGVPGLGRPPRKA